MRSGDGEGSGQVNAAVGGCMLQVTPLIMLLMGYGTFMSAASLYMASNVGGSSTSLR